MNKRAAGPSTMYSDTPCDECGGLCLAFPSGSIWCPNEDAHPGGHFVVRVAFERRPVVVGEARGRAITPHSRAIKPRPNAAAAASERIRERLADKEATRLSREFAGGYDDFVESES